MRRGPGGTTPLVATRIIALLLALPYGAGCSDAPRSDQVGTSGESIFRFVQLVEDTIRLGEPPPARVAAASLGDTIVALPAGSFGGAERIYIVLTSSGLVKMVTFDYAHGTDFEAMMADYTSMLGPARREPLLRTGQEPAEVALWRDAQTEFSLIRDPNRSAWTVRGVLRDRALSTPQDSSSGAPRDG